MATYFSPSLGTGIAAGSAQRADLMSKLQSNHDTMVTAEKARIQYMRDEEARRGLMDQEYQTDGMPKGQAPVPVAGLPAQAPAATVATTPVPDASRNQYIARNVTPQVAPNQSNAESKRLASKAPPKPGILEQVAAVTTMPGALAVGPSQYMTDADRFAELKRLNPSATTGGNESMAEARRVNANPVPAASARAPAVDAQSAIGRVLGREGGFVNDPNDRGGATNFGISSRAYPNIDVSKLTKDQAAAIYKRDYWDAINADSLPANVRELAFDAAVNHGVKWTKDALAASGGDPAKFLQMRRDRYQSIVAADKTQAKFLDGWMNRLNEFGQAPMAQAPAAAPTQTAGAPATTPTQTAAAPASAAPATMFSRENIANTAAQTGEELRYAQMQLAEINRQLKFAPDRATAQQLADAANKLRFGARNAIYRDAAVRAASGNEDAMASLAQVAGVQYALTPQGYVEAALEPTSGQYRAVSQPMSREDFVNNLYSVASGAAAKQAELANAQAIKTRAEMQVNQQKFGQDLQLEVLKGEQALQKLIMEAKVNPKESKITISSYDGKAYVTNKDGVFMVEPGRPVNGIPTEPTLVPIPASAMPSY